MAKGYAGYIMEEWRKFEEELLLDTYLRVNNKDEAEEEGLFENVAFKPRKTE